jgi:4-amino-4-deoxy-L-arabinose transferase-like glycosyltransferase
MQFYLICFTLADVWQTQSGWDIISPPEKFHQDKLSLTQDPELKTQDFTQRRTAHWILMIGLLLIMLAGAAMRLIGLGSHPYGVYQDEAVNGLDALSVINGARPLYFEANNGREPFFIYLVAISTRLFGQNPLGLRAAAAFVGLLTIAATYLLGRTWHSQRVGLIATGLLAVTLWHVHLSHISFRAGSLPLFSALSLGLGALALKRKSWRFAILAGVSYGLSFYTYLAARFTPLALLLMALYGWLWHREWIRARLNLSLWWAGGALIAALPLIIYGITHTDIVMGRSGQVAIWNQPDFLPLLGMNILRAAGMFTWRGDWIWRHNVPNRPVFDPIISLFFLTSVVIGVMRWRKQPVLALSLIWMSVMMLPTLLADDTPHFLRAVGVLPVVLLLPAAAMDRGLRWLSERRHIPLWAGSVSIILILTASAVLTERDYFGCRSSMPLYLTGFDYVGCYRTDPMRGYFFQAQATDLANELNAAEGTIYLDQRFWDTFPSVRFLVLDIERVTIYREGEQLSEGDPPLTLFAWPYARLDTALHVLPENAQITVIPGPETRGDQEEEPYQLFVRFNVRPLTEELSQPLARFSNGLVLQDMQIIRDSGMPVALLTWSVEQFIEQPVQAFVHFVDAGGNIIAQFDEPPGTVYYPPLAWGQGSVIIQRANSGLYLPPGNDITLRIGLYDPQTSERFHVLESRVEQQDNGLILHVRGDQTP